MSDRKCIRCGQGEKPWGYSLGHDGWASIDELRLIHQTCLQAQVNEQVRADVAQAIKTAGIDGVITEVGNHYESDGRPWFLVDSPFGQIRIAWCNSVIELGWDGGQDGRELFGDEGVTVGPKLVHANGYDKLVEYLRRLMPARERALALGREVMPNMRWAQIAKAFDKYEGRGERGWASD